MNSSNIDWEKVKSDIAGFGTSIYPYEECTIGEFLGHGGSMDVYEGHCNINTNFNPPMTQRVAFKRHRGFNVSRLKQYDVSGYLEEFRHEIDSMNKLKYHSNIVQIYGVTFNNEHRPILIVELGKEPLDTYLRDKFEKGTPASWKEKIKLCLNILEGIRGMHNANIIHGDIKGENVIIFINDAGLATAKISDFGYSSSLSSSKGYVGGTQRFMAPEDLGIYPELKQWQKTQEKDIFGFGFLAYQMATNGKRPYEGSDNIVEVRTTDRDLNMLLESVPYDTPEQFREIILQTTKFNPADRASLDTIEGIIWGYLGYSERHDSIVKHTSNIQLASETLADTSRTEAKKRLKEYVEKNGFDLNKCNTDELCINDKKPPLIWSVCEGDLDVIRILVEDYRADIRKMYKHGWSPLHHAASDGCIDVVKLLVNNYKVEPSPQTTFKHTPLHFAAQNGHINVIKFLLDVCKVDVNAQNNSGATPLHFAAQKGHNEVVRLLLTDYKANANAQDKGGRTPLYFAVEGVHNEIVRLLLIDYKVNVNAQDNYGYTPLHSAAKGGHNEIVKLILTDYKANINAQDNRGYTPLHFAAKEGHNETVRLLLTDYKANVNAQDNDGYTPLHFAAEEGHNEIVRLLLTDYKVNVNAQENLGHTPLHFAAEKGQAETVNLLLTDYKANPNIKDNSGKRPLSHAAKNKHMGIVHVLRKLEMEY